MSTVEKRGRGRGRPTRLTEEVASALVFQVRLGASLAEAARTVGVGERTVRTWRGRAWSRDPRDRACVDLERRLHAAEVAARASSLDDLLGDLWGR